MTTRSWVRSLWSGTDLAVGATLQTTATYTVTEADVLAGVVTNIATAQGFFDGEAVVSASADVTVVLAEPEIMLVKEADVEVFSEVDEEITFTFTLTNTGNVPLEGPFTIDDPMVMVVADEPGLMVLAPGASTTFTATYLVTEADLEAGVILNTATAEALFGDVPVVSLEAEVTIPVAASPALTLAKSSDVATFTVAGDEIVYTYTLTNTGNVALEGPFTVEDDMIVGPIAVVGTDLAVGASLEATATYTVTEADVLAGFVTNIATAQGFYGDTPVVSASATVTVCMTLADRLAADGRFTTLLAAAEIAGLDGALADPSFGPVTLFAPTDDAFAALQAELGEAAWDALLADPEALEDVLLYHLLTGKTFSADVVAGITAADPDPFVVETLLGADVEFTRVMNGETQYFINDSEIFEFDIEACNGVIHVIDAVLVPIPPALELVKTASTEGPVAVGDEIIYTYTLTNIGSWMLDGPFTVVDDKFMAPIEIDPVVWTELAVGASVEVTASYMVTIADVLAGTVTNEAYARGWFDGVEVVSDSVIVAIPADAGEAEVLRWYEASPGVWLDATAGITVTLEPDVEQEFCFYVYFDDVPGMYAPFDVAFDVYEANTMNLLNSTSFEVNLSASGG
jgi:large repetitive protein